MRTRRQFSKYVNIIAKKMGLAHWTITIDKEDAVDALLSVSPSRMRHNATIHLGKTILTAEEDEQRYGVVHELVHLHFAHADHLAGEEMFGARLAAWTVASEYATDSITRVIAPSMPLPSEVL